MREAGRAVAGYHRRRHAHRRGCLQGLCLRRGRGDDRLHRLPALRSRPPGLQLGHGDAGPEPAARHAHPRRHQGDSSSEILLGPPASDDGSQNFAGSAAICLGVCGANDIAEFQLRPDGDRPRDQRPRARAVPAGPACRYGEELDSAVASEPRGRPSHSEERRRRSAAYRSRRRRQGVEPETRRLASSTSARSSASLIARRVREANVYCELVPHHVTGPELKKRTPVGLDPQRLDPVERVPSPGATRQVDPEASEARASPCSASATACS